MQWLSEGDYQIRETLWEGSHRLYRVGVGGKEHYLLEERDLETVEAALAASESDREWQQWMTYCHHRALLLPVHCEARGAQALVLYPSPGPLECWPCYVEQVHQEYMADEELTLELVFHLTQIWGAIVGHGLRPVNLQKPEPKMVLLTGDGEVFCLPPRFDPQGETAPLALLRGLGDLMFAALTRQSPEERGDFLTHCRDLNREITREAEALVRRTQKDQRDGFEGHSPLARALVKLHIGRASDRPYRDSGPLISFRPNVATRDQKPALSEAVAQQLTPQGASGAYARLRAGRLSELRYLWIIPLFVYLLLLSPLLGRPVDLLCFALPLSFLYWGAVLAIFKGYRREHSWNPPRFFDRKP